MSIDLAKLHNLAETARARLSPPAANHRSGRTWYTIENAAAPAGESAVIHLYDMIGDWGITAADFARDLAGIRATSIELRVSCEGGEVFDGLAIYETLRRHPADITAYVDGIAASSASFVVCAANKIVMAKRGRMMIHDAHGVVMGNARDMREMAQLLDDLSDTIADIYTERSGTRESWRAAMRAAEGGPDGTWYDAESAVRAGLADEVQDGSPAGRTPVAPRAATASTEELATWQPAAFLAALGEISNPVVPAEIPDGTALRALFDLA